MNIQYERNIRSSLVSVHTYSTVYGAGGGYNHHHYNLSSSDTEQIVLAGHRLCDQGSWIVEHPSRDRNG